MSAWEKEQQGHQDHDDGHEFRRAGKNMHWKLQVCHNSGPISKGFCFFEKPEGKVLQFSAVYHPIAVGTKESKPSGCCTIQSKGKNALQQSIPNFLDGCGKVLTVWEIPFSEKPLHDRTVL